MATMINERSRKRRIPMMNIHRYRIQNFFFVIDIGETIVELSGLEPLKIPTNLKVYK